MKLEIEIHPAQAEILTALLFTTAAKFSELNATKLSNDHFSFHLKRLQGIGLLGKNPDGRYHLTKIGKEFANRLDTDEKVIERQAKLGAEIVVVREGPDGQEFLVQQRLKQPYYGFYGYITGKIRWGEPVLTTAARELLEETGLQADLRLVGIQHKLDYLEGELQEDKYFYVVRATNPRGQLKKTFEGGRNLWLSEEQIFELDKTFQGIEHPLHMAQQDEMKFIEVTSSYHKDEY